MYNNPKRKFLMYPLFGAAFVLLGGLAVMLLWNAIIPDVISAAHPLKYIQAIGLLILCKILFGGFRGRPGYRGNRMHWKEKMEGMSEEEREKFRAEWRQRCGRG